MILFAIAVVAIGAAIGCDKTDKTNEKKQSSNTSTKAVSSNICCKAHCKNGTCYAYGSDCDCYCTFFGYPRCQGSSEAILDMDSSLFDGRIYVQLSPKVISNTQQLCNLLSSLATGYALDAAKILSRVDDIVQKYGFSLSSKQAVYEYNKMIDDLDVLESHFSEKQVGQISDLLVSL